MSNYSNGGEYEISRQLTLLLLVKDTPTYVQRWVRWMSQSGCVFPIFIADGSRDASLGGELDRLQATTGHSLTISYEFFGPDTTRIKYYKKIASALEKIASPFTAVLAPDDFPIVAGLNKALQAVAADDAVVAARGRIHSIRLHQTSSENSISTNLQVLDPSMIAKNPAARLYQHFCHYAFTYHDVARTEIVERGFKGSLRERILDPNLQELYLSSLLVCAGKVLRVDTPFIVRETRDSSISMLLNTAVDAFDQVLGDDWARQYWAMIGGVGELLCSQDQSLEERQAKDIVHGCIRRFMSRNIMSALNGAYHRTEEFDLSFAHEIEQHHPSNTCPNLDLNTVREIGNFLGLEVP